MILLNKKRMVLFTLVVFISIVMYLIFLTYQDNISIIPVSNMNINEKTVIIDARTSGLQIMVQKVKMGYQKQI